MPVLYMMENSVTEPLKAKQGTLSTTGILLSGPLKTMNTTGVGIHLSQTGRILKGHSKTGSHTKGAGIIGMDEELPQFNQKIIRNA